MVAVEPAGHKAIETLLAEQVDYYRARAPEYDDWFLRRGRYDRGSARNRRWFEQVEVVRGRLETLGWSIEVRDTEDYFLHGSGGRA
jgi:hypothetical protein